MHFQADPPLMAPQGALSCFHSRPQTLRSGPGPPGARSSRDPIQPGFLTYRVKRWRELVPAREDRKPGWIVAIGTGPVIIMLIILYDLMSL